MTPIYDDFNPCERENMSNAIHASIHEDDTTGQEKYYRPLPSYGRLYTTEQFIEDVTEGYLMDHDGSGCFVKGNKMSDEYIDFNKLFIIPEDATHVMWFGK